jgi:hypothetical protein
MTSSTKVSQTEEAASLERGQRVDRLTGLVQPWFTHAALDEIQEWDLRDKVVLEWGGGHSTLWWAHRCRRVCTIETNLSWCEWISEKANILRFGNITLHHRPLGTAAGEYVAIPPDCDPNIVVIDGATQRLQCLRKALTLPRPITLIFDNWQQDGAFISSEAVALMRPFLGTSYPQMHPDHERHPWQTAIWLLH